jgi:hypothetical protein
VPICSNASSVMFSVRLFQLGAHRRPKSSYAKEILVATIDTEIA